MFTWHFHIAGKSEHNPNRLLFEISNVFADGFGIGKGWGIEEVEKAMRRSSIFGVLVGPNNEVGGYAFYSIPNTRLSGGYLLWEDAICIRKHLQGAKFASRSLFEIACGLFKSRRFDWIGGRTQNPLVILRYSKLGMLFPFDHPYRSDDGKSLMKFLLENIDEVKGAKDQLDRDTGICRGVYPEGKLGDFSLQLEEVERFEKYLRQRGFHRDQGDAVITMAKLSQPIHV